MKGAHASLFVNSSKFYDKRMGAEVVGDDVDERFKGYVFKITGGNDKDGFPMKQGVMVRGRVRLLLSKGHSTYRPRRTGERKRKSVRGCIVGPDLSVISLAIVKVGETPIEGKPTLSYISTRFPSLFRDYVLKMCVCYVVYLPSHSRPH